MALSPFPPDNVVTIFVFFCIEIGRTSYADNKRKNVVKITLSSYGSSQEPCAKIIRISVGAGGLGLPSIAFLTGLCSTNGSWVMLGTEPWGSLALNAGSNLIRISKIIPTMRPI
jgi:hypothetical protein